MITINTKLLLSQAEINELVNNLESMQNTITQLNSQFINLWLKYVILTWQWYLLLCLTIIPWLIWKNLRKKESSDRLFYVAFFVMLISSWLDLLGIELGFWAYHFNVIPFYPAFIPWDITLLPIFVMIILQYKPKIKSYIKAAFFSFICSFIFEPIFEYMGLYHHKAWKHYYSLPLYIAIYLTANYLSKRDNFKRLD